MNITEKITKKDYQQAKLIIKLYENPNYDFSNVKEGTNLKYYGPSNLTLTKGKIYMTINPTGIKKLERVAQRKRFMIEKSIFFIFDDNNTPNYYKFYYRHYWEILD